MNKNYTTGRGRKITTLVAAVFFSCCVIAQTQLGWIEKANFAGPARHRAAAAAVGNRGYMGLGHINSVVDILFDDWFEYDPGSDSWTQKASYPGGARMQPATFVINNKIYVGTGRDVNTNLLQDFWCYDPTTNSWSSIAPFPGAGRRGAIAFTLNGMGYVGTGSYHSNFFKYDPASDTWFPVASLPGSGRISAVACAINGKGYLSTGDDGGPTGDMWEYDPVFDSWTMKANLPGLPRMEACGFALNNKFFVGTGDDFSSGTNYQDFWCYDPATDSWIQVTDFLGAARRYMSAFVIGNRAYTGLGTSGINYHDLWEYGTISGVEETTIGKEQLGIYPNPVSSTAQIHFPAEVHDAELSLTDLSGNIIQLSKNINGNDYSFSRNSLSAGIYLLTLTQNGKPIAVSKLILE
jgi:N-acetylneuraminic acid mutarotase